MSNVTLVKTSLRAGVWEGELSLADPASDMPEVQVTCLDVPVAGHTLTEIPDRAGTYVFQFTIPADALNDGISTFLFADRATGDRLGSCTVFAGEDINDDIRAELDLMRAELDMLKRAFRRHCMETGAA
ncbi:hypothetical protein [Celeribacter marinus]|nr:hypothetical protein [Celeribacter marinus]SFK22165.1 hypothetical protein SAMN05444421_102153 [Celeribacter marinus]